MKPLKKHLDEHNNLVHSTLQKIESHVQRQVGNWIHNTILLAHHDVPFKYKRKKKYRNLKGARVDLLYYAGVEVVAGMEFEVMNVVKINIS